MINHMDPKCLLLFILSFQRHAVIERWKSLNNSVFLKSSALARRSFWYLEWGQRISVRPRGGRQQNVSEIQNWKSIIWGNHSTQDHIFNKKVSSRLENGEDLAGGGEQGVQGEVKDKTRSRFPRVEVTLHSHGGQRSLLAHCWNMKYHW